jgi:glucose-1-phosphate adenylyltransferase
VRAKASVPFAGQYRLIDFTLSNLAHSGIDHVGVLSQYLPESLKAHIGIGRPWDFDRRDGGIRLLEPYYTGGDTHWYRGSADALAQNLDAIDNGRYNHVLVVTGDDIYKMDYRPLLDSHRVSGADLTVVVKALPAAAAAGLPAVEVGPGNVLTALGGPPAGDAVVAALPIYVFECRYLVERLRALGAPAGDIVADLVTPAVTHAAVYGFAHYDYWAHISSVDDYYRISRECLAEKPRFELNDPAWPLFTRLADDPPVKFGPEASVSNSLVANGCIINGRLENAVLGRRVYVEKGAVVKDAIIFDETKLEPDAAVERAVVDKRVRVRAGARVGADVGEPRANADFPDVLSAGLALVGKRAVIPAGFTVGRNCVVDIGITAAAFGRYAGGEMPNGSSLLAA